MEESKKSYYCPYIANGVHFVHDRIRFCSANKQGPPLAKTYKGEDLNWDEIQKDRERLLRLLQEGQIPEECEGCFNLNNPIYQTKYEIENTPKIKHLYISNWLHCNTGCIYCINKSLTHSKFDKKVKKSEYYDSYPIIENLVKNNILDKNAIITFTGGEPTVLKEFDKLLEIIAKHVTTPINVLSSGIRFNKTIYNNLKKDKVLLVVSIDSGSRETYKKIKRVDEFNNVINNLKKYAKASPTAGNHITSKYILIDKVNDNIEEIEKWLNVIKSINIKNVRVDVEYSNSALSSKTIPKHYYDIFAFVKEKTQELGLNLESIDQVNQILQKGYVF